MTRARRFLRFARLLASAGLVAGCGESAPAALDAATDAGDGADAGIECTSDVAPEADLPEPARHTPRWAFEPWISKDISDRADTLAFVDGFRSRDIPVGAVVLDSPWDVQYTTFTPSPARYGDFPSLVAMLHAMGIRVVLWTTQMVNTTSFDAEVGGDAYRGPAPNFAEGRACGFYVQNGQTYAWWKGRGAGVDFFDPRARAWWHAQQNRVLDAGLDGWKLDFGDSYLEADDPLLTDAGEVPHQAYSEAYYRDFLAYGRSRRGADFVTMVRGWDVSYDRRARFFARPEHAPIAWAGDNRRDWVGLADALDTMLRSAAAGYVVVGSDVGGYLDRDDVSLLTAVPFDGEVFDRWVALGAMSPFMQLHGRANLSPWTVPERVDETIVIYRYWAHLHHAMVPFWYSLAEEAHAAGAPASTLASVEPDGRWAGDFRYTIGDAFLVAPIVAAGGVRDVVLPSGSDWYDWWAPGAAPLAGGTTLPGYDASDRARIPIFVRAGAIVPMDVATDANGLGTAASAGSLTVLAWPGPAATHFRLHEADDSVTTIGLSQTAAGTTIDFSPARARVIARVGLDAAPTAVRAGTVTLPNVADRAALDGASAAWTYETATRSVWIRTTDAVGTLALDP